MVQSYMPRLIVPKKDENPVPSPMTVAENRYRKKMRDRNEFLADIALEIGKGHRDFHPAIPGSWQQDGQELVNYVTEKIEEKGWVCKAQLGNMKVSCTIQIFPEGEEP